MKSPEKNLAGILEDPANVAPATLKDALVECIEGGIAHLTPEEALKFLFSLDNSLYEFQGRMSVAYDGGIHTKHRHTKYHDFFTDRIGKDEQVLDLGCGIGALAFDIAERSGAIVVAIDLNEYHLEFAKSRYAHPRITYVLGDVLSTDFSGDFDTVVMSNVLEHLNKRPAFLKRVSHVTRTSRYLIRVPSFERDWRVPLKKELGMEYRLDPTHYTEYTLESFHEEMSEAGLDITYLESRWGEIWAEVIPVPIHSIDSETA